MRSGLKVGKNYRDVSAKQQNNLPLVYMSLNENSLYRVLESLTTHVNEVDQSGRVFCSYSDVSRTVMKKMRER